MEWQQQGLSRRTVNIGCPGVRVESYDAFRPQLLRKPEERDMAQSTAVQPIMLCLHLCERVICDLNTRQVSLINLITALPTATLPLHIPGLYIYSEFTGCHGAFKLRYRITDADDTVEVCELTMDARQDNPLLVAQAGFHSPPIMFPKAGTYRVQALSGTTLLMERSIVVIHQPPGSIRAPQQ